MKHIKKVKNNNVEDKKNAGGANAKLKLLKDNEAVKGPRDCIPLGT